MARELSKRERLKLLLAKGYFPKELPPPFHTDEFSAITTKIEKIWTKVPPKTQYETYSYPRPNINRRQLAIVNPISHFFLSAAIADKWIEIRKALRKTKVSAFSPVFSKRSERAFAELNFQEIERLRIHMAGTFTRILSTDISRYYPSIYTHSLAWALHGKKWCKQNLHKPIFVNSTGNLLDVCVRKGQDNQTVGIPIGPDTSIVLGELIGAVIDSGLPNQALGRTSTFRFTDDIVLGLRTQDSSETRIAAISKQLAEYSLELNAAKTKITDISSDNHSEWQTLLRQMQVAQTPKRQESSLEHFFKTSLALAREHPDDNVLNYAVKRSRSFRIITSNWPIYESFLLRIVRANPTTLRDVAQIIIDGNHSGAPVDHPRIKLFCEEMIAASAPRQFHAEVSWCLFLIKALKLNASAQIVRDVQSMDSSACNLVLLDLESKGQTKIKTNKRPWLAEANKAGLEGPLWLLIYEGSLKGWLRPKSTKFIEDHDFFGLLWRHKVSFYDTSRNVLKMKAELRKLNAILSSRLRISEIF